MIEAPHSPDSNVETIADGSGHPNQTPRFSRDSLQKGIVVAAAVALLGWGIYAIAANLREDQEAANAIIPTMEMPQEAGGACVTRNDDGSICFNIVDGKMYLEAFGLEPNSAMTITSSAGSLNLDVQPDGMLNVEVGGKIVQESFQAKGTWADGEEAGLNLDIAG